MGNERHKIILKEIYANRAFPNTVHNLKKELSNCIRDYNNKHKPSELRILINELRASQLRLYGSKKKYYYGLVKITRDIIIVGFTTERYWNMNHNLISYNYNSHPNYNNIFCLNHMPLLEMRKYKERHKEISDYIKERLNSRVNFELYPVEEGSFRSSKGFYYNIETEEPVLGVIIRKILGHNVETLLYNKFYIWTYHNIDSVVEIFKSMFNQFNIKIYVKD